MGRKVFVADLPSNLLNLRTTWGGRKLRKVGDAEEGVWRKEKTKMAWSVIFTNMLIKYPGGIY